MKITKKQLREMVRDVLKEGTFNKRTFTNSLESLFESAGSKNEMSLAISSQFGWIKKNDQNSLVDLLDKILSTYN